MTAGRRRTRSSSRSQFAVPASAHLLLVALGQAALLAACATAGGSSGSAAAADPDVTIRAADMRFEDQVVTVAAGKPFTILLRNRDGAPHNVAIYADRSPSPRLFAGDVVTGTDVLYQVPAIEPGAYTFVCELHPSMTGKLIAEGVGR